MLVNFAILAAGTRSWVDGGWGGDDGLLCRADDDGGDGGVGEDGDNNSDGLFCKAVTVLPNHTSKWLTTSSKSIRLCTLFADRTPPVWPL